MSARLTDQERRDRAMLEAELQELIIDPVTGLAPLLGWETLHVRPGMRANGRWWTATTGSLARWPDLTLVRTRDRRLIFAELKRELERPTDEQEHVLAVLRRLTDPGQPWPFGRSDDVPLVEVYVWRPSDLRDPVEESTIYRILR